MLIALSTSTASVAAHEYWLDPIEYYLETGGKLIVDARNGQEFSGTAFPYVPKNITTAILVSPEERKRYQGKIGDYPAFHYIPNTPGLWSLTVETTRRNLDYQTWKMFQTFLDYHGLNDIAVRHRSKGLPLSDIREHYYRFAKAFVIVRGKGEKPKDTTKHATNALSTIGTRLELILLTNPYDDITTLKAQLLYQGEPLANRQVELFQKGSKVERVVTQSNNNGEVTFDIDESAEYMMNAVHVIESGEPDIHWESLWASLTFERN